MWRDGDERTREGRVRCYSHTLSLLSSQPKCGVPDDSGRFEGAAVVASERKTKLRVMCKGEPN